MYILFFCPVQYASRGLSPTSVDGGFSLLTVARKRNEPWSTLWMIRHRVQHGAETTPPVLDCVGLDLDDGAGGRLASKVDFDLFRSLIRFSHLSKLNYNYTPSTGNLPDLHTGFLTYSCQAAL
jgi:hypothetical protein